MASTIILRQGNTLPSQGSGITLGEPVFNTDLHTFHIGLGYGITAEMVGAPIVQSIVGAGDSYKVPSSKATKDFVSSQITSSAVISFNGLTGAVIGASLGANTFTGLNTYNEGISASGITAGGMVIQGNLYISGTFDALVDGGTY